MFKKGETSVSPFFRPLQEAREQRFLLRRDQCGMTEKTDMRLSRDHGALYPHLAFTVDETLVSCFYALLQQGVMVRCRTGCSVAAFLKDELKAGEETIEKIQSIILDGKPVDDLEAAWIKDGSTLALSAAMPGLVGATLRRGGAYSSFRSAITYHETKEAYEPEDGVVKIKIFNLLMSGLGRDLLKGGVMVPAGAIRNFLEERSYDFWQGCRQILLDSAPIALGALRDPAWLSGKDQIILSVIAA